MQVHEGNSTLFEGKYATRSTSTRRRLPNHSPFLLQYSSILHFEVANFSQPVEISEYLRHLDLTEKS
jgi:hypothetical protein